LHASGAVSRACSATHHSHSVGTRRELLTHAGRAQRRRSSSCPPPPCPPHRHTRVSATASESLVPLGSKSPHSDRGTRSRTSHATTSSGSSCPRFPLSRPCSHCCAHTVHASRS